MQPETLRIWTRGYLPHWEVAGAIYFVTFRLVDSLPRSVLRRIEEERETLKQLLALRNGESSVEIERKAAELFSERVQGALDAGIGGCALARPDIAAAVADALHYFDGARYRLCAWCIMPNHVHVVFRLYDGWGLSAVVGSWKSFSAKQAQRTLHRSGRFWQREHYDHIVRSERELRNVIRYVAENPQRAGLVGHRWMEVTDPDSWLT